MDAGKSANVTPNTASPARSQNRVSISGALSAAASIASTRSFRHRYQPLPAIDDADETPVEAMTPSSRDLTQDHTGIASGGQRGVTCAYYTTGELAGETSSTQLNSAWEDDEGMEQASFGEPSHGGGFRRWDTASSVDFWAPCEDDLFPGTGERGALRDDNEDGDGGESSRGSVFGQYEPLGMPAEPERIALRRGSISRTASQLVKRLSRREDPRGPQASPARRAAPRHRKWVVVDNLGKASMRRIEKQYMTSTLGVPGRDVRVLDPYAPLPYPCAVFIREKAVVLNLEAVKAIVTQDCAFILAVPVVREAQASVWGNFTTAEAPAPESAVTAQVVEPTEDHPFVLDLCKKIQNMAGDWMPFPLMVLEAAVAGAHKQLEGQVDALESRGKAALDTLTTKVTRGNLERVHKVKSQMNKLSTRVEKLREEIDKLLDDDDDMRALYLKRDSAEGHGTGPPGSGREDRQAPVWALTAAGSAAIPSGTAEARQSAAWAAQANARRLRHSQSGLVPPAGDPTQRQKQRPPRHRGANHAQNFPKQKKVSQMRKVKSDVQLQSWGHAPSRPLSRFHASSVTRAESDTRAGNSSDNPGQRLMPSRGSQPGKITRARNMRGLSARCGPELPARAQRADGRARPKKLRKGHADVQEAEALLEVYVTSAEFLESRLGLLKERIDDTEDLINIELDSRYNELQMVNVYFLTFALSWSFAAVVVSIWGMNLCQSCGWHTESGPDSNRYLFFVTVGYTFVLMACIAIGFFIYIQAKGLSFIPEFSFFAQNKPMTFQPWWSA
uniref:Magnesium transporter mrs2-3-like n=1 Tax=Tetraselmis sp. GSL018 TaxID=582737 RepID=A0A061SJY2_9CHLO